MFLFFILFFFTSFTELGKSFSNIWLDSTLNITVTAFPFPLGNSTPSQSMQQLSPLRRLWLELRWELLTHMRLRARRPSHKPKGWAIGLGRRGIPHADLVRAMKCGSGKSSYFCMAVYVSNIASGYWWMVYRSRALKKEKIKYKRNQFGETL